MVITGEKQQGLFRAQTSDHVPALAGISLSPRELRVN
jgi:hypothetical protein